jgi:tetratricopeptide (TPR) repeat protein
MDSARGHSLLSMTARARHLEDHGQYALALAEWRKLRPLVPADADLELAIALNQARSNQLDSAAALLSGRLLAAAAVDTLPATRFRPYPVYRDTTYLNGRFDGWHWYVWRARAEVAARRGRWDEAVAAARQCVVARPGSGQEWLLLAVCAGKAGEAEEARTAARLAVALDASLPETHYLDALWSWREGRRAEAQAGFRAAFGVDSVFQPAAVALVRSRLPGSAPDSLPSVVLHGSRAAGMLTSAGRPKLEELVVVDQVPIMIRKADPRLSDSLKTAIGNRKLALWVLVDIDGRVILTALPWTPPGGLPTRAVSEVLAQVPHWRFLPANSGGAVLPAWVDMDYAFPR